MANKRVKVRQNDPGETTKVQIITGQEAGLLQFGPHAKREDRVVIPEGTEVEVLDTLIRGSGTNPVDYYYIADISKNGDYRRYFIKAIDVRAI